MADPIFKWFANWKPDKYLKCLQCGYDIIDYDCDCSGVCSVWICESCHLYSWGSRNGPTRTRLK